MAVTVRIPTTLRSGVGGKAEVAATGTTVRSVPDDLDSCGADLEERRCDGEGRREACAGACP